MRLSALTEFLNLNNVEYKENLRLAEHSPIKIGGIALIVIYPDNADKLITTVNFLEERQIGYRILGRMSNVLLPDGIIETVIIKTDKLKGASLNENILTLSAGEMISRHAAPLAQLGFCGFLGLCGIPGSIGGMLRGNAGAFGDEMKDVVKSAIVYSPDEGRIMRIEKSDMGFGYRKSIFQSANYAILSVILELKRISPEVALKTLYDNRDKRARTQPIGLPSLGSVFKRPEGDYAARLIDTSGLRGYAIGGAMVSEKHAGFIVNANNATSYDVKMLVKYIKQVVNDKFGVILQEEIEFL